MVDSFSKHGEVNNSPVENKSQFDPDKRVDVHNQSDSDLKENTGLDPDSRMEVQPESNDAPHTDKTDNLNPDQRAQVEPIRNEIDSKDNRDIKQYTTLEERIEAAGRSKGKWDGEVGKSMFHPENSNARKALEKLGQKGIEYKNGSPDFSKVADTSLKIDNMSSSRVQNFRSADIKAAEMWNNQKRDGRTDWKQRDVTNWRRENRYSWHERIDRQTMDLVPRDIHDECKHYGGVCECKRAENANEKRSEFDE